MFDNVNLGNISRALQLSRGNDEFQMPEGTQEALQRTGSSYVPPPQPTTPQVPAWVGRMQQGASMLDSAGGGQPKYPGLMNSPMTGASPQSDGDSNTPSHPGLANSPIAGLAKKVVSAVAAYYTGGLSAAAMNVGGQMLSQRNPRAGAMASAAQEFI